jgi:DNA primase
MKNDPRIQHAIDHLEMIEVLDEFHVDYTMSGKNIGVGYVGVRPCPFCGDNRNHWAINLKQKFATCFKCKEGMSTYRLISYYGRMNFDEVREYLLDKIDYDMDVVQQVTEIIRNKKEEDEYIPTKKDELPPNKPITYDLLRQNPYYQSFFIKRKLYYWDIKRYDLRWAKGQIIFPVYLRNKIVSYQMRNIRHKWYSNGTNLGSYICYEDHILKNKPLILVEGFLDYTRINSYIKMYYKNEISVTTGYVKMVSNKQIRRIIKCNPSKIIVMFDSDSWFDYERIKNTVPMDVDFIILPKNKDPNDLTWSEIYSVFKEIK